MKLSENHNLSQLFLKSVEKNSFTDSITSTAGDWKLLITTPFADHLGEKDIHFREV